MFKYKLICQTSELQYQSSMLIFMILLTLQSTDYKTVQTNKHVVKYYLSICVKLFLVIGIFVGCPDLGFAECCSFALRETVQELGAEQS